MIHILIASVYIYTVYIILFVLLSVIVFNLSYVWFLPQNGSINGWTWLISTYVKFPCVQWNHCLIWKEEFEISVLVNKIDKIAMNKITFKRFVDIVCWFLRFYNIIVLTSSHAVVEALLSYNRPMKQLHDMYILIYLNLTYTNNLSWHEN